MYKLIALLFMIVVSPVAVFAQGNGSNGGAAAMTDEQATLYSLGLSLAESAARYRLSPTELEIVVRGLRAGVQGRPSVDITQYTAKVYAMGDARLAVTAAEQRKIGTAFRSKALQEPGAVQKESGLIIIPIHPGSGPMALKSDTVAVVYTGSLPDGTVFDKTGPEPFKVPLSTAATPCLLNGIQLMKVGEQSRILCPPELVRGMSHPLITPGSTLIYDITLVGISH
jgi:FKBP-type peptidyl-prolyl cis-trans isomerase